MRFDDTNPAKENEEFEQVMYSFCIKLFSYNICGLAVHLFMEEKVKIHYQNLQWSLFLYCFSVILKYAIFCNNFKMLCNGMVNF